MKNVKLLIVCLLIVNCTTDISDLSQVSSYPIPEEQTCIDDLPNIRITNNGSHSFDFIIYDLDDNYAQLYVQNISATANSNLIELSSSSVVIVASNVFDYGQKVQLSLENCDVIELEVDASGILTEL